MLDEHASQECESFQHYVCVIDSFGPVKSAQFFTVEHPRKGALHLNMPVCRAAEISMDASYRLCINRANVTFTALSFWSASQRFEKDADTYCAKRDLASMNRSMPGIPACLRLHETPFYYEVH